MSLRLVPLNLVVPSAVLALMVACGDAPERSSPRQAKRCGWSETTRLTADGIGALRVGTSAAALARSCDVIRDTIETLEGQPQRVMYVRLGTATAYAEVVGDTVWRIGTRDPLLRTTDDLGVGSSVTALIAAGPAWTAHGEGAVAVGLRRHCGLSFLLTPMFTAPNRPFILRDVSDLQRAPAGTAVERVLIVGNGHCTSPA